jgi:hypothetical protein
MTTSQKRKKNKGLCFLRYRNLALQGFFVLGYLGPFLSPLQAEPEIEVSYKPSRAITVGKICEQTIQLIWKGQEAEYLFQEPEIPLENFVIEERGESNEVFQKGGEEWKKKTFRSEFRATQTGKGRLGPFRLNYIDPAKQQGGHFEIPSQEFKIAGDPSKLYRGGAIALGIAAGSFMGAWVIYGRLKQRCQPANAARVCLEDRFITRLNQLKENAVSSFQTGGPVQEAGKLFRAYLGEKYAVGAAQPTSQEMTEKVRGRVTLEEFKILKRILEGLDEWGYASQPQAGEGGTLLLGEMIRYIEGKKTVSF